jgi:hypothetical protein
MRLLQRRHPQQLDTSDLALFASAERRLNLVIGRMPKPAPNQFITWRPRLGRDLSREDARQIAENFTGFFAILADWPRTEMPAPANDKDKGVTAENEEAVQP